ncbi:MAG: transketolase [Chitinivibrionales bacterium]|nr:transketolase [Chitinivibrionales bacterium]
MHQDQIHNLRKMAFDVRRHILTMSTRGGCFVGASFSCTDILICLYQYFLNISKSNLQNPGRDYFFLSKGHAAPALYGVLAESGLISKDHLNNHLSPNDHIYLHPNPNIPGIEFHSGSLGHMLPLAVGVAIDCKRQKTNNRVVVVTGDGELNEGSNWEALLTAQAYKLDNMIIITDRNQLQANVPTEDLIPLEKLEDKFAAFGCGVTRIDGHDFEIINNTLTSVPFGKSKPSAIIAETVRGKGIPSMESRTDKWFMQPTVEEASELMREMEKNWSNGVMG